MVTDGMESLPTAPLQGDGLPVECPLCSGKGYLTSNGTGACSSCSTPLVADAGRIFPVFAVSPRLDAADVPRHLAAALRARRSPRHEHLLELLRLELPYWDEGEALVAAFPTPMGAARRIEPVGAEASPAPVSVRLRLATHAAAGARALLLVPAFGVRYEVRGRPFHAVVEAVSGKVFADVHPSPWTVRVRLAMAGVLLVDVAAFAIVAWLAPDNPTRALLVAALGLPVYAFTAAAFRLREKMPEGPE